MCEPMDVEGWIWREVDLQVFHSLILPAYTEEARLDTERVEVHGSYSGFPTRHFYTEWGLRPGRVPAKEPGGDRAAQLEGRVPIWAEKFPVDDDLNRTGPTRVWVAVYQPSS